MKQVVWLGASLEEVRSWTAEARRDTGYQLFKIQSGVDPSDWKPMPRVGIGVQEIRIHCDKEVPGDLSREVGRGGLCLTRVCEEDAEDPACSP